MNDENINFDNELNNQNDNNNNEENKQFFLDEKE